MGRRDQAEVPLSALFADLARDTRRYAELEISLVAADLKSALRRGMNCLFLVLIAALIGLVGVFVLAQAAIAALSPAVGGEFPAALIVSVALFSAMAAIFWLAARQLQSARAPQSLLLQSVRRSSLAQHEEPASASPPAAEPQMVRDQFEQTVEAVRERLTPNQIAADLLVAVEEWTGSKDHAQSFVRRHPVVAGAVSATAAWLLLPRQAAASRTRKVKPARRGTISTREYSNANHR